MLILAVTIGSIFVLGLAMRGFNPFTNQVAELTRNDRRLIKFAIGLEGLTVEQQEYVQYMGDALRSYNVGHANNVVAGMLSAFVVLAASYTSVGVTGSGYLPCETAKAAAFLINLVAALIAGTSQLFLFDKTADRNLGNASKLRWEIWQFVGSSQEYQGLDINERYNEFTRRTDILIDTALAGADMPHKQAAKTKAEEAREISDAVKTSHQQP